MRTEADYREVLNHIGKLEHYALGSLMVNTQENYLKV